MTVPYESWFNEYIGDGSATIFPYSFWINESADLGVFLKDADGVVTELVEDTDYTITGAGLKDGGSIVTTNALETGEELTLVQWPALVQLSDFRNAEEYVGDDHELALDKIEAQLHKLQYQVDQCMQERITDGLSGIDGAIAPLTLPAVVERAGGTIGFTSDETAPEGPGSVVVPVSTYFPPFIYTSWSQYFNTRATFIPGTPPAGIQDQMTSTREGSLVTTIGKDSGKHYVEITPGELSSDLAFIKLGVMHENKLGSQTAETSLQLTIPKYGIGTVIGMSIDIEAGEFTTTTSTGTETRTFPSYPASNWYTRVLIGYVNNTSFTAHAYMNNGAWDFALDVPEGYNPGWYQE